MKLSLPFFIVILFLSIVNVYAQQSKWIVGPGEQTANGNWNNYNTGNLHFHEIDFTGGAPLTSTRTMGNSINQIYSYGTSDPGNSYYDRNGKLLFYVFCSAKTLANANPFSAPGDTFYIVEYDTVTHADEVKAKFATDKFGASVLEMGLVGKGCIQDHQSHTWYPSNEYFIIYKSKASTYWTDDIKYVVYNYATKTVSAPTILTAGKLTGEGMAISNKIDGTSSHYLFYTTFDTSNFNVQLNRCLISSAGISAPTITISHNYPVSAYPNINPCYIQISPDGTKIAICVFNSLGLTDDVLLFDLNMANGTVSNCRTIDNPNGAIISCEFSSNSQMLYLYQNVNGSSPASIYYINVPTTNTSLNGAPLINLSGLLKYGGCHMERAYDGNIYFNSGFGSQTILQISNVNSSTPVLTVIGGGSNSFYGNNEWAGSDLPDQIDGMDYWSDTCIISKGIGIESFNNNTYSVYPNPAYNSIVVEASVQGINKTEVSVYNYCGVKIYSALMESNKMEIEIENWPEGLYLVDYSINNNHYFKKIIKAQ